MAMEIIQSRKQLHVHMLPIISIAGLLVIATILGFNDYSQRINSQSARKALTSPIISIHPSTSGLAHINAVKPQSDDASSQSLEGASNAGNQAALNISLAQ